MAQLMALGLNDFKGNALGSFMAGQQQAMAKQDQQLEHAKQNFTYLAQMAHDAQGDPAAWEAGLDAMEASGWSGDQLAQFRGRADLAPILARSALTAQDELTNNYNQAQLDLSRKRFAFEMAQAAAGPKPTANMIEYGAAQEQGYEGTLADWMNEGSSTAPTYGTTVLTGRDGNGNVVPLQAGSGGDMVRSTLPDGITFDPGAMNAERAAGTKYGAGTGQVAFDLPTIEAQTEFAVNNLNGLIYQTDQSGQPVMGQNGQPLPNRGMQEQFGTGWFGLPTGQTLPAIANTEKANFQARREQVQGQAFLQAVESLKGSGAISEIEGTKATQAILRAQTSQTEAEFVRAIQEAIGIYERGLENARRQAAGTQFTNGATQQSGQPLGNDPLGLF